MSPPALADVAEWASSGGMYLTGWPDEAPLAGPAGVLAVARAMAEPIWPGDVATLLFGRAALAGFTRRGRTSAGGSCRLLRAANGWVALNLSRPDDVGSVGAIVGGPVEDDPWLELAGFAASTSADAVAERAQLLGVPAAALGSVTADTSAPTRVTAVPGAAPRPPTTTPVVVDLSSLWAGPLCTHLLAATGARVIKVESTTRPDGARSGDPRFFDWLHAGQEAVALEFESPAGRAALRRLLEAADVVVEASRPRALRQLGIDREAIVALTGTTWISITGYGGDSRVAFGDDAAVAGGLVGWDRRGEPVFCADAIADPLSGLYAAAAALDGVETGGGRVVDVAMSAVAAHVAAAARVAMRYDEADVPVAAPRLPGITGRGPALGADTARVLSALAS